MSSESPSPERGPEFSYDSGNRLADVREVTWPDGSIVATYTYYVEPRTPSFTFEHDKQKHLFILKWPDGKAEHFRDNPTRHLMVEPDPETGEMRPVVKRG